MHSIPDRASVSIIISNYNYARFLRRAVGSALEQDYDNVEVIVVDDASTDNSAEVIASYGSSIKACLKEANGGHGGAFNTGFAASSGEIVLFLDADDYLYPNAVSEIVNAWEDDTVQVQFRLHLVDEDQQVKDIFPPSELPFDSGDVTSKLLQRTLPDHRHQRPRFQAHGFGSGHAGSGNRFPTGRRWLSRHGGASPWKGNVDRDLSRRLPHSWRQSFGLRGEARPTRTLAHGA